MDIFECIENRRSIRKFEKCEISDKEITKILKAGAAAPSACNIQPWKFIVIKDENIKNLIVESSVKQTFIADASVVIAIIANLKEAGKKYEKRGRELYSIQDTAAAVQNMMLASYALGYGTCWIGAFDENEIKKILKLKEEERPMAILPIGKPSENPVKPKKKNLEEIVEYL